MLRSHGDVFLIRGSARGQVIAPLGIRIARVEDMGDMKKTRISLDAVICILYMKKCIHTHIYIYTESVIDMYIYT